MPYADPDRQRDYQREWVAARYALAVKVLGGMCAWCGSTEGLEIDHIRPSTKDPAVRGSRAFRTSWPWERILRELAKCWLLCRECHRVKTRDDLPESLHGTTVKYDYHGCRCPECRAGVAAKKRCQRAVIAQRQS